MFELNGKYNTAKVFTDNCDGETMSQITTLLNQEFIKDSKICIMPDTHAGAGCVIGTTMTIADKIVPNLVGVDISCGMLCIKLQETEFDPGLLDYVIQTYVPFGFSVHHEEHPELCTELEHLYAPVNKSLAYKSIGSLGGGNHYIEIDKDEAGLLYLVIHSGSRHLGLEVAKCYQELAVKNCNGPSKAQINALIQNYKAMGKQNQIAHALTELKNNYPGTNIPKELCYIQDMDFNHYIHDMKILNLFARANRQKMADEIITHMNWHITDQFATIHNYIDTEHMILRKGAVSAQKDEKLIIPMNMRDGALICIGKGNPNWNYSAPHGAGRLMSRSKAKDLISMKDFKDTMFGVYSSSVCESTLDEAPQAYKPMQEIIDNIQDTVTVQSIIKPVYNFKAH